MCNAIMCIGALGEDGIFELKNFMYSPRAILQNTQNDFRKKPHWLVKTGNSVFQVLFLKISLFLRGDEKNLDLILCTLK